MQAIPAYLINLARRPDRLAVMEAHLAALGIGFERIDAVDGKALGPEALDAWCRDTGPLGWMATGTRACTASHLTVWEAFLASGRSHALVLEDDVELARDCAALLEGTGWIPPDADLIKIEKYSGHRPSRVLLGPDRCPVPGSNRQLRRLHSRHTGSGAYIISRGAAGAGLALKGRIDVPIDHVLFNRNVSPLLKGCGLYLIQPLLARQRPDEGLSDVAHARPGGIGRRLLSVKRGWHELTGLPRQLVLMARGQARMGQITWAGADEAGQ